MKHPSFVVDPVLIGQLRVAGKNGRVECQSEMFYLLVVHLFFSLYCLDISPFRSRCSFLHDGRIKATACTAEFTCKDMQTGVTSSKPGVLIDSLYNCRTSILRFGNPLGFHDGTMDEMMKVLCQTDLERPNRGLFTEKMCLEIALLMRKDQSTMSKFTFWPTHLLYQTIGCMILQRKVFVVREKLNEVEELSDGEYEIMKKSKIQGKVLRVHKLAFGPAFKRGISPPSLFFHLSEEDLIAFPPEKIKKFLDSFRKAGQTFSPKDDLSKRCADVKHHVPSFIQYEPMDDSAFNLVTNMMKLRLQQLKIAELPQEADEYKEAKVRNDAFQIQVEQECKSNKISWTHWFNYPRCSGLEAPQSLSDIAPSNSGEYEFPLDLSDNTDEDKAFHHVRSIWETFVASNGGTSISYMGDNTEMERLSVFTKLAAP